MTTADLKEKARRFPVPLICAAIVVVCGLAYYFRMDLLDQLESKADEASRRAMQMDDNLLAGATLSEHLADMKQRVATLESRIVRQSELAPNLKYFYEIESATGVSLADLRQNPPPPPARTEGKPDAKAPPPRNFANVGYTLMLSGTYAQVVAFFDELENGSRLYHLRNFSLQRGRDANQPSVTLAVNLDLLGWP